MDFIINQVVEIYIRKLCNVTYLTSFFILWNSEGFYMNKHELSKILSEYTLNNNKVEFINVDNQMNIPEYWKEVFENR